MNLKDMLHNQRGALESVLITIIGIGIGVVLMIFIPLIAVSERNDDIAQNLVQTVTAEFGDKIAMAGVIKQNDYEEFLKKLAGTGNTYDVDIEVQILDENPGKKAADTSQSLVGENLRYSIFDSVDSLYDQDQNYEYPLGKGYIVIIRVKNINPTLARQIKEAFLKFTGKDVSDIATSYSVMVLRSGNKNE